jgi:predicted DsbA family dithiol-disulfide isomerase
MSTKVLNTTSRTDVGAVSEEGARETARPVKILYATDPICSHCWAMEPAWRKFLYHYGEHVEAGHVYGGLLPRWEGFADMGAGIGKPADVAPHWDEVVERYGQPIDSSVWYRDPLSSSFPSSVALHAVRRLDPAREEAYLRRVREQLFLEAKNIARADVLIAAATDVGLDAERFRQEFESAASWEAFVKELEELRTLPVRGFPTLIVSGPAVEEARVLRGTQPYFRMERALEAALGELPPRRTVEVAEVLDEYGSGTTREFMEVLELDEAQAEAALRAAGARSVPLAGSALWSRA